MLIGPISEAGRQFDYDTRPLFAVDGPSFCTLVGAAPEAGPGAFARYGVACPAKVARSAPARQVDYLLGRLCARVAVRRFDPGFAGDIPAGPNREPVFPAGLSGSITHTDGYVAAVCQGIRAGTVGLDAETLLSPDQAAEIGPSFAAADEIACPGWGKTPPETRYSLVFSAKEAAYKALFPWVRSVLPFDAARLVRVNLDHQTLSLGLAPRGDVRLPGTLEIRFRVDAGRVVTFAVVRPRV